MRYEIVGETLPAVICTLEEGETMITEKGAMSWMSPNMKMETSTNGGIGKAFGRMFSGESIFQNTYTAKGGHGMIAFASSFPGKIVAHEVAPGREIVVQKSGFLAAEAGVDPVDLLPEADRFRNFRRRGIYHAEAFRTRYGISGI